MSLLSKIARRLFPDPPPDISGPFSCPVCKMDHVDMAPLHIKFIAESHRHQHVHNPFLAETINFEHYTCRNCGAADRDRLYALYLNKYMPGKEKVAFLDIAPSGPLAGFIKSFPAVQYRSMDLYMEGVDDHLDITDMQPYKDGQYDFLICSHVLEHIPDDRKAIKELYRILKPGGQAIAMVPINLGLEETMEDPSHTSVADRWKYYGQDDHVRMYAKKDFVQKLEAAGFKVAQLGVDHFGKEVFERNAIFPTSILYLATK